MPNDNPSEEISCTIFKGLRTNLGQKFAGKEFFFDICNYNYDNILGATRISMPIISFNGATTNNIDGLYEYKYLNESNVIVSENIFAYGGSIYSGFSSPKTIKSGLTPGFVSFAILNDKLAFSNGVDFPMYYNGTYTWEMGAPLAIPVTESGNLSGNYYYAQTYVTSGGEEILGTISNVITATSTQAKLELPIGYDGTLSRKLYRTIGGGNELFHLADIADNTIFEYTDNIADGSLGAAIPAPNNMCPKPHFLQVSNGVLIGGVIDLTPTQVCVTGSGNLIFDNANNIDIADTGTDNSSILGIALDYNLVVCGTEKQIYLIDLTQSPPTVTRSRANLGVKNGRSMITVPSINNFPGGVTFVTNQNDIRVINGNFAQPVATSLDNIQTNNYSEFIRNILTLDLTQPDTVLSAIYFNYKYHLIVKDKIYFIDLRDNQWGVIKIKTDSYSPLYNTFGIINNRLYAGQKDSSIIENWYVGAKYRNEDVYSYIQSGQIIVSSDFKYIKDFYIFFATSGNKIQLTIKIDGSYNDQIYTEFNLGEGNFYSNDFSSDCFYTSDNIEDYRSVHIDRWARWVEYKIESNKPIDFKGFKFDFGEVENYE